MHHPTRMATHLLKTLKPTTTTPATALRRKTTSAAAVSSRPRDPTFEKLMDKYKHLLKVLSIHDLLLSLSPSPSLSLLLLSRLSHRDPSPFLRRFPHIFSLSSDTVRFSPSASSLLSVSLPPSSVSDTLRRLLSLSLSRTLPLRALLRVRRHLGLPDDFHRTLHPRLFRLTHDPRERNTHLVELLVDPPSFGLTPAVEKWRALECCKEGCKLDEVRFGFKHGFPPGMRVGKNLKAKVKEWQRAAYVGPYEKDRESAGKKMGREKRAVAIVHEFLSLTVEKMVEVEKISHFRKWFGIELNVRDLFLDHPGMFYLSTKGKRHTVFLREAYERGCLVEPNPVYEARRKLLHLVMLERRGVLGGDSKVTTSVGPEIEQESDEEDDD